MCKVLLPILAAAVLATAAVFLSTWQPATRLPRQLPHDAYVWQRAWTPSVSRAVSQSRGRFAEVVCLAAEIDCRIATLRADQFPLDYGALKQAARAGLAIRIAPYAGHFVIGEPPADAILRTVRGVLDTAHRNHWEPAEIQIDFDCAESKLNRYAELLDILRPAVGSVPLTITALPVWLDASDFAPLVRRTDGYVLQVHSLRRPKRASDAPSLLDFTAAMGYVERAGRIGVGFRVALPTYGYRLAIDGSGRVLGIAAEGPLPEIAGARVMEIHSNPAEVASLVAQLCASPPDALRGIIWYRLPIDDDVLNWKQATLDAVMAGRAPAPRLQCQVVRDGPTRELRLENDGDDDASLAVEVAVTWAGGRVVAADAIGGFALNRKSPTHASFHALPTAGPRLRPGDSRLIGWLRFDTDTEVQIHVQQHSPG